MALLLYFKKKAKMKYLNEGKCDLQVGRARSGWPSGTQGLIGGSGAVTAKQKKFHLTHFRHFVI